MSKCVVGDPWFCGLGWDLKKSILGSVFDGVSDWTRLHWGLGVSYFYEVEKEWVVSLVQRGSADACSLGSSLVSELIGLLVTPNLRVPSAIALCIFA